jgi:Ig-fold domain
MPFDAFNFTSVRFQTPEEWGPDLYDAMIIRVSNSKDGSILMEDSVFLWKTLPKFIANLRLKVDVTVKSIKPGPDQSTAVVSLSSNGLALYVVLTARAPGRFEENAIVLRPSELRNVTFVALEKDSAVDLAMLRKSLRVEHFSMYACQ